MPKSSAPSLVDSLGAKLAFAITEKGHAYDAARAKIRQDAMEQLAALMAAHKGLGVHDAEGKNPVELGGLLRFGPDGERPDMAARHQAYVAKQHAAGSNAWNPFGGLFTPLESERPRGTEGFFGRIGQIELKPEYAQYLKKESAAAPSGAISKFLRSRNFKTPATGAVVGAGAGAIKHMLSDDPDSTLMGNVIGGATMGGLAGGAYRAGQRFTAPARRASALEARAAKKDLQTYIKGLAARDGRAAFGVPDSLNNVPLPATALPKRVDYQFIGGKPHIALGSSFYPI